MFDRLDEMEFRFTTLTETVNDPAVIADNVKWRGLMKEHNELTPVIAIKSEFIVI